MQLIVFRNISLLVGTLLCSLATSAWGHIDVEPRQSVAKRWETYTLRVPTETPVPTVKIHVVVPPAFEIEMVEHSHVWQIDTERDARGFIRQMTWRGGSIPPQTFAELKFLARNPGQPGMYRWETTQYYQESEPAAWTAQTQIVALERASGQRDEDAWRAAQVATTVSLMALGLSITLILITVIGILRPGRQPVRDQEP